MDLLFNSPNLNNKAVSVWDEHIWKCRGRVGGGAACHQNSNTFPSHTERLVQLPSCFSLFFFFLETCGFILKHCANTHYIFMFLIRQVTLTVQMFPPPQLLNYSFP